MNIRPTLHSFIFLLIQSLCLAVSAEQAQAGSAILFKYDFYEKHQLHRVIDTDCGILTPVDWHEHIRSRHHESGEYLAFHVESGTLTLFARSPYLGHRQLDDPVTIKGVSTTFRQAMDANPYVIYETGWGCISPEEDPPLPPLGGSRPFPPWPGGGRNSGFIDSK